MLSSALNAGSAPISKALHYAYAAIGTLVILLAIVSFVTQMTLADILAHVERLFGLSFIVLFVALSGLASYSVFRLYRDKGSMLWAEVGLQAANGISTLALTFTLLGISLGIGSLSNQPLTPDTVQNIIGQLTAQFSMAFMTTVVGLPCATLFRAIIGVMCTKYSSVESNYPESNSPEVSTGSDAISQAERIKSA